MGKWKRLGIEHPNARPSLAVRFTDEQMAEIDAMGMKTKAEAVRHLVDIGIANRRQGELDG